MIIPKTIRTFFPFAFATAIAAAAAGSLTEMSVHHWYLHLNKPAWTAPPQLFGPVWTVLYASMALAAWLVYRKEGWENARGSLTLWGIQLILNALWPGFFFALRSPFWGSIEIAALLAFVIATTISFWKRDRTAGLLMAPYGLWVSYAAALTIAIWRLNLTRI
jgi:benzodiazapine receptor